jgi:hypothetical protein
MREVLMALAMGALCARFVPADVHIVEEVVNSGLGSGRVGARKTVNRIFIKGVRQRVDTQIEASQAVERQLRAQGQRLAESTILQLDSARVYAIDPGQSVYTHARLPAPKPVGRLPAAQPANRPPTTAAPSRPDTAVEASREISFRSRALADTLRVQGLLCRRVAAELLVRHYAPGTRALVRTNRYLYQAWMARDFPGYDEIKRFRELQRQRTSYPSLLNGGLEQIRDAMADGDRLSAEIDSLSGFPMHSELRVSVRTRDGETPVVTLSRRVLSLEHAPLPDSLFGVTPALRPAEE